MTHHLAFVFPGQGSQSSGMLADLAEQQPSIKTTFEEASQALDYDLWQLVQESDPARLNQTEVTQPALLTAGVALWRAWQDAGGVQPGLMAGHSLGEYTALVCAGALQFGDGVRLVRLRGQYMQEAVAPGEGAMAAIIGLDDDAVVKACAEASEGDVVAAVNFNSPGQVVIAGEKEAVDRAIGHCKDAGAKRALPLPVSVPSHCDLMKPAADQLRETLASTEISRPRVKVINNVDVAAESDPEAIRKALVRQLYRPVRWTETVRQMAESGVTRLVECGPGAVLCGLTRRIDRNLNCDPIGSADKFAAAIAAE